MLERWRDEDEEGRLRDYIQGKKIGERNGRGKMNGGFEKISNLGFDEVFLVVKKTSQLGGQI